MFKFQELALLQEEADARSKPTTIIPATNYKDKYKHLIGEDAAKDAAKQTLANKSYGFGKYNVLAFFFFFCYQVIIPQH